MVQRQLESVLIEDIGAQAIKTGMLFNEEIIKVVVEVLERHFGKEKEKANLVLDPVCVSTSGHSLLAIEAVDILRSHLLPWATVVTPNIPEAEFLTEREAGSIKGVEDMRSCARDLAKRGTRWVYLKGGHLPITKEDGRKVVVDLLWDAKAEKEYLSERKYLDVKNTHGTGCTLAAAVASGLAKGQTGEPTASLRDLGFSHDFISLTLALLSNSSGSRSSSSRLRSRRYRFLLSSRRRIRSRQSFPLPRSSHPPSAESTFSHPFHRLPDILQPPLMEPLRLSPIPSRSSRRNDATLFLPPLYTAGLSLLETIWEIELVGCLQDGRYEGDGGFNRDCQCCGEGNGDACQGES